MSYFKHLPILKQNLNSLQWLTKSSRVIYNSVYKLKNDSTFLERNYLEDKIVNQLFIPRDLKSIDKKYAKLVANTLNLFEVLGIWKIEMIPGTTETIKTVRIYGYSKDVKAAIRLLNYLITHFNDSLETYTNHYKAIRRKLRRRGKPFTPNHNARTLATDTIKMWINRAEEALTYKQRTFYFKNAKLNNIFDELMSKEKLNKKHYNNMSVTYKSVKGRPGRITLNRIAV